MGTVQRPNSLFKAWNRAIGGTLASLIRDMRNSGMTQLEVYDALRHEHGIDVSYTTVQRWIKAVRDDVL